VIPLLLVLRIRNERGRRVNLYLPLFLVWVLLAPLALVALVVLCVVAPFRGIAPHRVLPAVWRVICGLRGLRVDVDSPEARVFVHFV
jgi:uncharacterized membrane protein